MSCSICVHEDSSCDMETRGVQRTAVNSRTGLTARNNLTKWQCWPAGLKAARVRTVTRTLLRRRRSLVGAEGQDWMAGALRTAWVARASEVLVTFGRALAPPSVPRAVTPRKRPEKWCRLQWPRFWVCDGGCPQRLEGSECPLKQLRGWGGCLLTLRI